MFTYNKSMSVGELVGKLYGKGARIITGTLAICVSLGYVSAQISSIGYILNYFFAIPFIWGVVLGYGIVIIYTTFGGIRSVVFTDVIQFGVMIVAIPLLFNVGVSQIGGISELIRSVPIENLSFISDKMSFTQLIILCITFSFVGFNPSFIQRLLIVKNNKQAYISTLFSAILTIPFFILVIGIGLIALSMDQNINPNFAFSYLIDHILPVGLKGLLIAGLISAIMSTADSDLNIIGISAINDVYIPLSKQKLSASQEVNIARLATFIFGLISIFIPLYFNNVIDIILFFTNFWAPTILIPLLMSMFGRKVSFNSFLICLASGILTMIIYDYYTDAQY
jgi:SSS family solute:Na+ symporter